MFSISEFSFSDKLLVLYVVVFRSTPPDVFNHSFVSGCFNSNRLLNQSVEELTAVAADSAIKPKRVLKVVIQMFMTNGSPDVCPSSIA